MSTDNKHKNTLDVFLKKPANVKSDAYIKQKRAAPTSIVFPVEYSDFIETYQKNEMMRTGEICTMISVVLKGLDLLKEHTKNE